MRPPIHLQHEFVEHIPEELADGVIYISITFATAVHKCCCGCGHEVVTPLAPRDWQLTFDGQAVSLNPSIGNWSLDCRSHYWVSQNRVMWANEWTDAEILAGRELDLRRKAEYYADTLTIDSETSASVADTIQSSRSTGFWERVRRWFRRS